MNPLRRLFAKLGLEEPSERPGSGVTGDPARAVVTYYHGSIKPGMRQRWFTKYVDLRLTDDPEDGPTTRVQVYLERRPHALMRLGVEVPVWLKPGTRTIIGIDADRFEAEAAANDPDA